MNTKEKENLISLIGISLISAPYLFFSYLKYNESNLNADEELKFWGSVFLALIVFRIVGEIVIRILIAIVRAAIKGKEEKEITDERDKLIELKATRNCFYAFTVGVVGSMILLFLGASTTTMFLTLILSGFVAELVEIASKIYYYKRG